MLYDIFYEDNTFDRARNLPSHAERGAYAINVDWDGHVLLSRRGKWVDASNVPLRFAIGQRVRWGRQVGRIVEVQACTATIDFGRGIVATANQAHLRAL